LDTDSDGSSRKHYTCRLMKLPAGPPHQIITFSPILTLGKLLRKFLFCFRICQLDNTCPLTCGEKSSTNSEKLNMASCKLLDMELQVQSQPRTSGIAEENPSTSFSLSEVPQPEIAPRRNVKLFSAAFSFFVAGVNDGSMGALLPYMIKKFHIGTSFVAILLVEQFHRCSQYLTDAIRYITTFLGWLVAAFTNSHAPRFFGPGALLAIGAVLQLLSQSLRAWGPSFGLFAVTFFITGLGQAYQDSHANTFVSSVKAAYRWLGFIRKWMGDSTGFYSRASRGKVSLGMHLLRH
jgi:hypothetical protein